MSASIYNKNFDGRFEIFEFAIIDPYIKEKKIPILEIHWSVLGENLFPIRVVNLLTGASSLALKEKTYKQKLSKVFRCRGVKNIISKFKKKFDAEEKKKRGNFPF